MRAFLVGLLFLFSLGTLVVIGILLFPLMLLGGVILWGTLILGFVILIIWLIGKVIIFIWDKFFKGKI